MAIPNEPPKERERPKKDKNTRGIQCLECSGYGHIRTKCPNLKHSKGQAMNASLSDESNDSNDFKEKMLVTWRLSSL
jgi:hypothetical protein